MLLDDDVVTYGKAEAGALSSGFRREEGGELISGKASTGYSGHQCSRAPGRPNLHLVLILSQTSAGN